MRQHSGVGIYQVINPVIRDTVKPIPTTNQIGLFPKKRFFRLDFEYDRYFRIVRLHNVDSPKT